jgi:hypothetical protein
MTMKYLVALCLPLGLLAACQDTSNAPAAATVPFSLGKCGYEVAARTEYTNVVQPRSAADVAKFTTTTQPNFRRIRLGLGGSVQTGEANHADPSSSVAIGWQTDPDITATAVQFGSDPDPSKWKPEDSTIGFSYVVPVADKAISGTPQQLHEVHLCGLAANQTYYYHVGGGPPGKEVWSDVLSFRTTPARGDQPTDAADKDGIKIAISGDSRGQHNNAWQILEERLYKRGDLHLQLFSGDMIDIATNQVEYEQWLDKAEKDTAGQRSLFGQVLTLSAMGNHDNYNIQYFSTVIQPQDLKNFAHYQELFFSVDVGPVHVVVLDDFALGTPAIDQQYAPTVTTWLKADLGAVDRTVTPWVIAVHHHPEWSSSNHGNDSDVKQVRATLVPIWDQFHVDVVFSGHDHNYERSQPLTLGSDGAPKLGQGTRYVVCAGSGAEPYGNGMSDFTAASTGYKGGLGVYGILSATKTTLKFDAFSLAGSGTDTPIDSFALP